MEKQHSIDTVLFKSLFCIFLHAFCLHVRIQNGLWLLFVQCYFAAVQ